MKLTARHLFGAAILVAVAVAGYVTWVAVRASRDLVTLDVRDSPRRSNRSISDAFLMYDYEKFHRRGSAVNILYADFHVDVLNAPTAMAAADPL